MNKCRTGAMLVDYSTKILKLLMQLVNLEVAHRVRGDCTFRRGL